MGWQQMYYQSSIGDCTIRVVCTIGVVYGTPHHNKINKACNCEKMWYNNNVHWKFY